MDIEEDIEVFTVDNSSYKPMMNKLKSVIRDYLGSLPEAGREMVSIQYSTSVSDSSYNGTRHFASAMVVTRSTLKLDHVL